jgi:cytochrome P450
MVERPGNNIDLLDPQAIEHPHEWFASVRRTHGPVAWSQRHRAWVITGHPELDAAFRSPELSTDRMDAFTARLSGERAVALAQSIELLRGWMLFHDPPEHTRLRAPFQRTFTPKTVSALTADIGAICDDLLDALAAGPDEIDLVSAFAHRLPAAVIARMFGVPDHLCAWLTDWSARFGVVVFGATRRADYEEVARSSGAEFHHHLGALLAERRARPRDDLVSALAQTGELTDSEVLGACSLLLFAGHDTTASLLASAVASSASVLREHIDDGGTLDGTALEEVLRFEASAKAMMRVVAEPVSLGDRDLQPGQSVLLTILAANRDPRVFDAPDELHLDRSPNPHLTFGHGHHFCLGSALARLELRVALPRLLRRFPELRVTGRVTWKPNITDHSPASVPITLGPERPG